MMVPLAFLGMFGDKAKNHNDRAVGGPEGDGFGGLSLPVPGFDGREMWLRSPLPVDVIAAEGRLWPGSPGEMAHAASSQRACVVTEEHGPMSSWVPE